MGRITVRRRITRVTLGGGAQRRDDVITVEEPLEIRVGGRALAVTMRTPGHDVDLTTGFLLAEGIISNGADVSAAIHCAGTPGDTANTFNVLDVTLARGVPSPAPSLERNFLTSSSCGLCGKASIEAVRTRTSHPIADDPVRVTSALIFGFPDRLRAEQEVFTKTGGLHAAALFDGTTGELLVLREDVGRHNAVDKVIGWAARAGLVPLRGVVLMVSGRVSFELAQKALMAGIPVLAAISAPSSLAIELADEAGMTVVGFLRGESLVVYSGAERIVVADVERTDAERTDVA